MYDKAILFILNCSGMSSVSVLSDLLRIGDEFPLGRSRARLAKNDLWIF
ncbi:hypothetical protein BCM14_2424 [Jezberella montanilacus]|uniref:Uncharacterized protein n=1 Tax=Jezberella montanilacus TaxID=323426 RepID=A0A2T0XE95_9BURK|nr:hypothetical protein [Jezberella montanilacus]PRY97279.1 hypothetical protein BCM14_2424 [Jezberella montanilacus]